jgi:hypothetical protein
MQSPKFSLAGWPRALPNLSNALDAASAISRLNGIIIAGAASIKYSSHFDERVALSRRSTQLVSGSPRIIPTRTETVEHDHSGSPVSSL